jgi:two-component system sensor histidine kinase KdpD
MADAAYAVEAPAEFAPADPTLELLSSIAHEFRAPLSALNASAEMLQLDGAGDRAQFAAIIQRQALRLNLIVDGLLESYRAQHGGLRNVHEIVDVRDLFDELRGDAEALFPRHHFLTSSDTERCVTANRRALLMILGNLLSNAAKYSPAGSTVRLVCERTGAGAMFSVYDQGPGVPHALRRRIFEPGARAAIGGEPGCGLGLFIARRLAQAIGATIDIHDSDDGVGACFAVSVPGAGGA